MNIFKYSPIFERNGVYTFWSFPYLINSIHELIEIIGKTNLNDAKSIWNNLNKIHSPNTPVQAECVSNNSEEEISMNYNNNNNNNN